MKYRAQNGGKTLGQTPISSTFPRWQSRGMNTDPPSTPEQHQAIQQAAQVQVAYLRWLAEKLRLPPDLAALYLPAAAAELEILAGPVA